MGSRPARSKRLMKAWPGTWFVRIIVVVGLMGAVLVPPASSAQESPGDDLFAGVVAEAEARGASINYTMPGFVIVEEFIDGGGPVAQSSAAPGTRKAFASLPYPGATAIGFPGLLAFVLGVVPPGYPLFVSASDPTQREQTLGDSGGPYFLSAAAHRDRVVGDARVQWQPGEDQSASRASAHTEITAVADKVTSQALSVANGITIGPLSVASLRAESISTYQFGASESETHTAMTIEGGSVGDVTFAFGEDGLVAAEQGVPIPAGEGLRALNSALEPAGLSVRFRDVSPVEGGAQSAAFEVVHVAPVPGAGTGTLTVRFGGVRSAVIPLGVARDNQPDPQSTSPPVALSGGIGLAAPPRMQDDSSPSVVEPNGSEFAEAAPPGPSEAAAADPSPVATEVVSPPDEVQAAPGGDQEVASTPPAGEGRPSPRHEALPGRLAGASPDLGAPRALAWLLAFSGLMSVVLLAAGRRLIGKTRR